MSERGGVHTFRPTYTEPHPKDPSKKILKTSKNWGFRFMYRNRPYQKAGFRTAAAARDAGEKRKAEVTAGLETDWRKFTVEGLYQLRAARKVGWEKSSQKTFEIGWKRIKRVFPPEMLVVDIDDEALLRFVKTLQDEDVAQNSIRLYLQFLKTAMVLANKRRRLPWIPEFPKVKYVRREQTVHPVELRQILVHLPECYHLLAEAAEEVGWRANSELRTRQWPHVDLGPPMWKCECQPPVLVTADECLACGVGRPGWLELDAASNKTDAPRLFPMTKRLRSILSRARLRVEEIQRARGMVVPWLFPRDDGRQLPDYRPAWTEACLKAGFGRLPGRKGSWSMSKVMHDIRRTTIRRWNQNLNLAKDTRKAMAGHVSDSAHALYDVPGASADQLRAAALQMDRVRDREEEAPPKVVQLDLFKLRG